MNTENIMRFLGVPTLEEGPTRISSTLPLEDVRGVLVLRHARLVIEALEMGGGAKLTATGNLSRQFVMEMLDRFDWPEYEKEYILGFNKVVNETDFTPLHYLRVLMQRCEVGFVTMTVPREQLMAALGLSSRKLRQRGEGSGLVLVSDDEE